VFLSGGGGDGWRNGLSCLLGFFRGGKKNGFVDLMVFLVGRESLL
jgi:hypothetical protein